MKDKVNKFAYEYLAMYKSNNQNAVKFSFSEEVTKI